MQRATGVSSAGCGGSFIPSRTSRLVSGM
jgi:hypothetical protein